jgi:hypothetical protein
MDSEEPEHYLRIEDEARQKVSCTLSKIEVALSEWDGAKDKPPEYADRIEYLRRIHDVLLGWARESLTGAKDASSVYLRIQAFTRICRILNPPDV